MLSKSARLTRAEFSTIFAHPERRANGPDYAVYYVSSPTFKASVVVGKKVAKQAVRRNQLRREVYGVLQRLVSASPGVPPTGFYIFIIKPAFAKRTKAERQLVYKNLLAQNLKAR